MKKYIKLQILSIGLLMASSISLYAQPGFEDDVDDVPIDGGISLLIAAGAVYGFKKVASAAFSRK
jgi:hypothetical protein